jgi:CubicO group peptidase (beta-lactamase class C family)
MTCSPEAPNAPIQSLIPELDIPELDRLAADVMADWKVPGAAVAVVQNGRTILTRAYGQRDVEANLPMTPATQFVICSITKSFADDTGDAVRDLLDHQILYRGGRSAAAP